MTTRMDLSDGWTLRLAGDDEEQAVPEEVRAALPIPAQVPGCVHTDLLAADLIPDPYLDRNEVKLDWVGRATWVYERDLQHSTVDGEQVLLAFEGLDTVAVVRVNDVEVARTENMHRRYEVHIGHALHDGTNRLSVRFDSAWAFGEAEKARIGPLPAAYPAPFNYLRKMACNFGWDWGPALVTAGIWRPVTLVRHTAPRISEVRPTVTVDAGRGVAEFDVRLDTPLTAAATVAASVGTVTERVDLAAGEDRATVVVRIDRPRLWRPAGFGPAPLYDADVRLTGEDGELARRVARPRRLPVRAPGHHARRRRHARSSSWSTTCRCRSAASTGSPTTASSPGSPRPGCAPASARRARRA